MTLEPLHKPALIVVDMQNDFVRAGAPLEVPDARATLPHHRRLLEACRGAEIPIVYVRYVAGPQHPLVEWAAKLAWAKELGASDVGVPAGVHARVRGHSVGRASASTSSTRSIRRPASTWSTSTATGRSTGRISRIFCAPTAWSRW